MIPTAQKAISWRLRLLRGCGNQYLWIAFGIHTTQSKHYQTSYSSDFFHHHHHWINGIKIELPNIVLLPLQILAHRHQRRTPPLSNGNGQEIGGIPRSDDKLDICFPQLPHTFTPSSSSAILVIHNAVWIIHSVNTMLYDDARLGHKLMSCRFLASTNVPFT